MSQRISKSSAMQEIGRESEKKNGLVLPKINADETQGRIDEMKQKSLEIQV